MKFRSPITNPNQTNHKHSEVADMLFSKFFLSVPFTRYQWHGMHVSVMIGFFLKLGIRDTHIWQLLFCWYFLFIFREMGWGMKRGSRSPWTVTQTPSCGSSTSWSCTRITGTSSAHPKTKRCTASCRMTRSKLSWKTASDSWTSTIVWTSWWRLNSCKLPGCTSRYGPSTSKTTSRTWSIRARSAYQT